MRCAGSAPVAINKAPNGYVQAVFDRDGSGAEIERSTPAYRERGRCVDWSSIRRPERNPVFLCLARQIILRQVWPIAGRGSVGAQHDERAIVAFATENVRGREASRAPADDDDRLWPEAPAVARHRFGIRHRQLFVDEDHVARSFHLPAGNRIQRWRSNRLAGAKVETGVMPGASDGISDDQTLGERSVIMRAVRPDRKDLRLTLDDHHLLVPHASRQDASVSSRTGMPWVKSIGVFVEAIRQGQFGELVNW